MKSELQIEISNPVEIITDEVEKPDFFLPDYTFTLTIRLSKSQIEQISNQIFNFPYYNELEYYRWKDGRRYTMDNRIYNFKAIQDSIEKTKYRGSWIKTKEGYEFIDFGKSNDIVHSWLNAVDGTLKFIFVDI